jgi:hypothetical protein
MMVESADTTDFNWSREMGNRSRDALKVGELSARSGRDDAEPSFGNEEGVETGRARPTSLNTIWSRHSPDHKDDGCGESHSGVKICCPKGRPGSSPGHPRQISFERPTL